MSLKMYPQTTVSYETFQGIAQKKAQYGRCIDTKQWDGLQHVALPNTRFRFCNPDMTTICRNGKDLDFDSLHKFVAWFSNFFEDARTLHMFGPPDMSPRSNDEVAASWAMEDQLCFTENAEISEIRGGGYYSEIWIFQAGSWWLKDLTLTRTYTKVLNCC